ncbi:MAG: hypothetical protein DRO39_07685, partial [Thermoprotei archaeon]
MHLHVLELGVLFAVLAGLAGAVAPVSARLAKVLVTAFVVMSSVFVGSEALQVWVAGSARVLGA